MKLCVVCAICQYKMIKIQHFDTTFLIQNSESDVRATINGIFHFSSLPRSQKQREGIRERMILVDIDFVIVAI